MHIGLIKQLEPGLISIKKIVGINLKTYCPVEIVGNRLLNFYL